MYIILGGYLAVAAKPSRPAISDLPFFNAIPHSDLVTK